MGINSIKCDGYADANGSGFGKGYRSSSDFDGTDLLAAAGMIALVSLASSGCISLSKDNVVGSLVKTGDFGEHVDSELNFKKIGDSTTHHPSVDDTIRYDVMFKGIGPDGKANFDILHNNDELKHFAVANYEKPDTYEKMLNVTDNILAGQSTDSVAVLKFEGTGMWDMIAYAYINGSEVDLKLVDAFRPISI